MQRTFMDKSRSLIQMVSILIVITTFGANLVVREDTLTPYQTFIRPWAFALAAVAFALFLMSIDILDTVTNLFTDSRRDLALKRFFYLRGVKRAYWGIAVFSVFLVSVLSFIYLPASGFYAGALAMFGYTYWFGEIHEIDKETYEYVKTDKVIATAVGSLLIVITVTLESVS